MTSASDPYRNRLLTKIILMTAMVLIGTTASPQDTAKHKEKPYALLYGTLWDANQRPVPGVTIYIRRAQDKKPKWTLVSNSTGEFAQRVPAGTQDYVVWAVIKEKKKPAKVVETKVHVDNEERVDFGLHLTE